MPNIRSTPRHLLDRAKSMRHDPAPAEARTSACLRDRQLGGYKFRRQRPTPPFIVDFCCVALGLVVEIDGDTHGDQVVYDARRTRRLERDGYRVIRFTNDDVRWHLDCVLADILRECERLDGRPPAPPPGTPGEGTGVADRRPCGSGPPSRYAGRGSG